MAPEAMEVFDIDSAGARAILRACVMDKLGAEMSAQETSWLTEEILSIYVRIRNNESERSKMLCDTIRARIARREFLSNMKCAACEHDARAHDARLFGTDADGDPVFSNCFALASNLNPTLVQTHMACLFERALRHFPTDGAPTPWDQTVAPSHRRWSWVIDIHGFGLRHTDPRTTKHLLELMQTIYPDRLKRLVVVDAPFAFWGFFPLVKPLIDPVTVQKIEFVSWKAAPTRYREIFPTLVAEQLVQEGTRNRSNDKPPPTWTSYYCEGWRTSCARSVVELEESIVGSLGDV